MSLVQTPRSERIQGSFPYVTLEYSNNIPSPSPGVCLFDKWKWEEKTWYDIQVPSWKNNFHSPNGRSMVIIWYSNLYV